LTLGNDDNFYGTTDGDYTNLGTNGGTIFQITTNGVLTTLAYFDYTNGADPGVPMTLSSDGSFYDTTFSGGKYTDPSDPLSSNAYGTVFQMTTKGALNRLYSFGAIINAFGDFGDGRSANGLTLGSDGNFYGTTIYGGSMTAGTVFQITTNGVLTTLVSFTGTNGALPEASLTLGSDGNFYGTTTSGGAAGGGVIYRLRHGASIQSFGMTTNGFQMNTLNVGGSGWVLLESSSDLMTWTPIQTNGTAAAQTFLEPAALSNSRQFYRVRQL